MAQQTSLHIGVILSLALRNLKRNARRTALTFSALFIGGALLIFTLWFGDGTHEQWIDAGVRTGSGHVTIEKPGFRVSQKIADRLVESTHPPVMAALATPEIADQVQTVFSRFNVSGLASSAAAARPALIVGVDPTVESALTQVDDQVIDGRYLEPDDRLAAYVGVGLADGLDLQLGSRLVLTAQDTSDDITGQLVRVVGVFETGIPAMDQAMIYVTHGLVGEWLGSGRDVTSISVMVEDSYGVPRLVRQLRQLLAEPIASGSATVTGWTEAMPELYAAVLVDEWGSYVVFVVLFVIIGFGIVNTVLMSVLHRHREFGVIQALGLTPRQTGAVVFVEGILLTGAGAIVGVAVGGLATWLFMRNGVDMTVLMGDTDYEFAGVVLDPIMIPLFRPARVVQAIVSILMIGVMASIYPAVRAATVDIAESMKFDR